MNDELNECAKKVSIAIIDDGTNVDDDLVDPWNVVSKSDAGVDYDKLISK